MATIDVSKIDGFEAMTADQKLEALLGLEIPDEVDMSQFIAKSLFDKKASELAEANRKLKDKMTDDEQKQAEEAQKFKDMQDEIEKLKASNDELTKNNLISEYTTKYLSQGYSAENAQESAKALASNDFNKVFEIGEKHRKEMEEKIK